MGAMIPEHHHTIILQHNDTMTPLDHATMVQAFLSKTIDTPALDLPPLGDEVGLEHCLGPTVSYC